MRIDTDKLNEAAKIFVEDFSVENFSAKNFALTKEAP